MRLEIKGSARLDLQDIADYIAKDNPDRAESFIEELISKMDVIRERPNSFPARREWGQAIRSALYGRYLILFRASDDLVEILRVLHSARDIDSLLAD